MNESCPCCGLILLREQGYFMGAMYFSYPLAIVVLGPLIFLLRHLLPTWTDPALGILAVTLALPLVPSFFRYARVIWMHFDRTFDPGTSAPICGGILPPQVPPRG